MTTTTTALPLAETTTTTSGGVVEKMIKESVEGVMGSQDAIGVKEITAAEFEEYIRSLEKSAATTEAPLTPGVKMADLWAWTQDPEDLVMMGILLLCGRDEYVMIPA
jgi:hypothetical protein